jgi:hypothetical protein
MGYESVNQVHLAQAGYSEHGNESLGSIKGKDFLDQLIKTDSTPHQEDAFLISALDGIR